MTSDALKRLHKWLSRDLPEFGGTGKDSNRDSTHLLNYATVNTILFFRDIIYPPKIILTKVDIRRGYTILDFGCGPGSYFITASELLDGTGEVFALDMHPLAIRDIRKKIKKRGIKNIKTILSDCNTGLSANSVDVIMLHYVFNDLKNTNDVLKELHRVLKPTGFLTLFEFDLDKISPKLNASGFFKIDKKMNKIHIFTKK